MSPEEILKNWEMRNNGSQETSPDRECAEDGAVSPQVQGEQVNALENIEIKDEPMNNGQIQNETPQQSVNLDLLAELEMLRAENARLRARAEANTGGATQNVGANGRVGYFDRYVEKECGSEEERKDLTEDVGSLWNRLTGYQKEENGNRAYGLAVGKVQSGKTRNYIGLMFKAIDAGYNTIIVLTSKDNLLAQQTHNRVVNWFGRAEGLDVAEFNGLTRVEGRGISWVGGASSPPVGSMSAS